MVTIIFAVCCACRAMCAFMTSGFLGMIFSHRCNSHVDCPPAISLLKCFETDADKRLQLAQNDFDIRWIASSGILTIHNRFCYFKKIGKFISPIGPVERQATTESGKIDGRSALHLQILINIDPRPRRLLSNILPRHNASLYTHGCALIT